MIQNGAPCRFAKNQVYLFKVLVLYYTKICYAEWFYYTVEKICHFSLNIDWKFITISENSETYLSYCFGIEFRFRFGKKSIFWFRSGFGPVSVEFHSCRSLNHTALFFKVLKRSLHWFLAIYSYKLIPIYGSKLDRYDMKKFLWDKMASPYC